MGRDAVKKITVQWPKVDFSSIRRFSHEASETLLAVLADATPWLVGLMPAVAIAHGLNHAGVGDGLVFVVAMGVELTGILAGHTLTEAREADRDTSRVWFALIAYMAVGVTLAVLLDVWPALSQWALDAHEIVLPDLRAIWPAVLAPMVVMAYWLRSERAVIRIENPAPEPIEPKVDGVSSNPSSVEPAKPARLPLPDFLVQSQPDIRTIMDTYGMSRTTAYNSVNRLLDSGVISKNGHGYEWGTNRDGQ